MKKSSCAFRAVTLVPIISLLSGCATLSSLWPFGKKDPAPAEGKLAAEAMQTSDEASLKKTVDALIQENEKNKQSLATTQMELQSLREQLRTAKRNLQVLNRASRSGLFYDDAEDDDSTDNAKKPKEAHESAAHSNGQKPETPKVDLPVESKEAATTEPSDDVGRVDFPDDNDSTQTATESKTAHTPAAMLADAEQKLLRAQFGEAVVTLTELQNRFPNYNDNGQGLLLLAESWLSLKNYNNVFPQVRKFYLKYPTSPDMLRAKLTEAQALEGLGSTERASQLYREVIGSGPQSAEAQRARAALLRLRDSY